jgi:hypothetical protein
LLAIVASKPQRVEAHPNGNEASTFLGLRRPALFK